MGIGNIFWFFANFAKRRVCAVECYSVEKAPQSEGKSAKWSVPQPHSQCRRIQRDLPVCWSAHFNPAFLKTRLCLWLSVRLMCCYFIFLWAALCKFWSFAAPFHLHFFLVPAVLGFFFHQNSFAGRVQASDHHIKATSVKNGRKNACLCDWLWNWVLKSRVFSIPFSGSCFEFWLFGGVIVFYP